MNEMTGPDRQITLRFLAEPVHVNFGGKVHGGVAMKWLDQAGYVCATGWAGRYCVTRFVGDINFDQPIAVGDLVQVDAKVIRTGRTSIHVLVDLYSCDPHRQSDYVRSVRCIMVFVAVDGDGRPTEVPAWTPETNEDMQLKDYADRVMELQRLNQKELGALCGAT